MNIESFIKKLQESEEFRIFTDEMNEMSTTAGVDGYQTPNAFSPQSGEGKEKFDDQTTEKAKTLACLNATQAIAQACEELAQ